MFLHHEHDGSGIYIGQIGPQLRQHKSQRSGPATEHLKQRPHLLAWTNVDSRVIRLLNTQTVSYGFRYTTAVAVCLPGHIIAIVFSENICLYTELKLQKSHKVESGHKLFIQMKG